MHDNPLSGPYPFLKQNICIFRENESEREEDEKIDKDLTHPLYKPEVLWKSETNFFKILFQLFSL